MLKKISFPVLILMALLSCNQKNENGKISTDVINNPKSAGGDSKKDDLPLVEFKSDRIEFGEIAPGEKITREFEFTNVGKSDLIIAGVDGDCGCTVARDWPKSPVKPGESGKFSVTFDSGSMTGQIVKKITMRANTYPSSNVVALSGYIVTPPKK